jgi:hypothetical protein
VVLAAVLCGGRPVLRDTFLRAGEGNPFRPRGNVDICASARIALIPWYRLLRAGSPGPVRRWPASHSTTMDAKPDSACMAAAPLARHAVDPRDLFAYPLEENLGAGSIRLSADEFRTLAAR